jgi:hypothetical protein
VTALTRAPLDDPDYVPQHPPVNGIIPDVVAKWGPRSQLRWFRRFRSQLADRQPQSWDRFYCATENHLGGCCYSCYDEADMGTGVIMDGWCCCQDERGRS